MIRRIRSLLSPGEGPPLREAVAGTGWYPLVVLTSLNVVDELDRAVLGIFGPNIKRYFDIDNTTLGLIVAVQVLALILLGIPVGYLGTKIDRALILRVSAVVWSVFSFLTAFAITLPLFFLTRLGTGVSKASVDPVGKSLLTDYYPPNAWNRVLAVHSAANPLGLLIGPALAGLVGVAVAGDGVWRWGFPLLTIPTIFVIAGAWRLREPPNQLVRTVTGQTLSFTGAPSGLSLREASSKLLGIPTFKRQLVGIGVLGFALVGGLTFFNVFLEEQYGVGEGGRGIIGTVLASAGLIGALVGGNVGERVFQRDPAGSVRLVGGSIALYAVVTSIAVLSPSVWVFVPIHWIALLAISVSVAPLVSALSAITVPRLRPLMFSLLGLFVALFGGVTGAIIVGAVADATSLRWGLATLAPFGVVGGLLMARGGETIDDDMRAVELELSGGAAFA